MGIQRNIQTRQQRLNQQQLLLQHTSRRHTTTMGVFGGLEIWGWILRVGRLVAEEGT